MPDYYTSYRKGRGNNSTEESPSNIDCLNAVLRNAEMITKKSYSKVSMDNWREDKRALSEVSKELRHVGELELALYIDALKNKISREIRATATAPGSRQKPS